MHWKNSQYRVVPAACVLLLGLMLLVLHHADPGYAQSAADKSGVIDLKGVDINAAGFTAAEMLINTNYTLNREYYNNPLADPVTNKDAITNNNICERADDSVAGFKDATSNSELTACWATWDAKYMYFAIQGQAKGRNNNLMAVIDSNVAVGVKDFNLMRHSGAWKRDILFDEGIIPNIYLGFWCENNTGNYNGTDNGGNTHLNYGDGYGTAWQKAIQSTSPGVDGDYFSWYNGSDQTDPAKRLWMFRVSWGVITNAATSLNNLNIRFSFASTGPDDGSLMYDYMPETQYQIIAGSKNTIQNNFFEVQPFDGSGNIRLGVNPRDIATVPFYPGSRWDVPNFPGGKMDMFSYNDAGRQTKAFTPNGDGYNDRIRFSFRLEYRRLIRCRMYVYDLKGRKVRTLFEDTEFDFQDGGSWYNAPDPSDSRNVDDSRLSWDGNDDSGNSVAMGMYIVMFSGEDGTIPLLKKSSVSVIR